MAKREITTICIDLKRDAKIIQASAQLTLDSGVSINKTAFTRAAIDLGLENLDLIKERLLQLQSA